MQQCDICDKDAMTANGSSHLSPLTAENVVVGEVLQHSLEAHPVLSHVNLETILKLARMADNRGSDDTVAPL